MCSDYAIRVKNVSKLYEMYDTPRDRLRQFLSRGRRTYYKEFWALKDVSLDVQKGETLGILGRNGSGKSTLLQLIAGTLNPTKGQVETNGRLAALLELGSGFNPDFSGRENVFLNGAILGLTQAQMEERFDSIASFADIGRHLDQPVKTYSSGMYVRLAFAVQACIEPDVLIVDEALSVGDEKFQRKCFDYIERLRSGGCAVLLVTHSTPTVEKFCQRAVLLHKGQLHGIGNAKNIVDQYHALLYADEKAYLKYLNKTISTTDKTELGYNSESISPIHSEFDENSDGLKAIIKDWDVLDVENQPGEAFHTGDTVKIRMWADILNPVQEVQAGILLRTVEGITAFGTSTQYYEKNAVQPSTPSRLQFDFTIKLDLCPGAYFVTLALAEAISANDMQYLDRKTDIIVLKISQPRILATGIAALKSTIDVKQVK